MNSLLAPCQVDQHMARIVEPRPVDLRALRAKRAARQMEAGQVALAAGKRLHGLDALAILDVDSRLRVDQRETSVATA